jgi:hypothetical protein
MLLSYTIIGTPPAPDQDADGELFMGSTGIPDRLIFMADFRRAIEKTYPGWSWTFHFAPPRETAGDDASSDGLLPEEMDVLKMFCKVCQEFTPVLAVYDSVESWTLTRSGDRVELGTMIEGSEIVGVRDFKCMECHEHVMVDGEFVESEEELLEIIDHQFME